MASSALPLHQEKQLTVPLSEVCKLPEKVCISHHEELFLAAPGLKLCDVSSPVVRSDSLKQVVKLAEQVARHPAAVLIIGETGTGKEMIARTIHNHSLRCNGAWVDVNCAAIPEHLVESELFGYEKGAFSGADTLKPGLFELADGGTLFLDEIGDLDLKIQVKLLRVLDGVPYYRLGGSRKVNIDVRVVAATNQKLEELVRAGRFRSDLYHRLAQFKLEIPPLRERPEDILGIAEQVLQEHSAGARLGNDALRALLSYSWPGNVRELKNTILRAALQAEDVKSRLSAADLQLPEALPQAGASLALDGDLGQVERQMIFQALERFGGNQAKAADVLGISRRTLLRKLKTYRETGDEVPIDAASLENQRFYRVEVHLPARIKYADQELQATLLNVSLGGVAVATTQPLKFGATTTICFSIPGTQTEFELGGQITWSNKESHHGIQFNAIPPHARAVLQRWLLTQMKKEQWKCEIAI